MGEKKEDEVLATSDFVEVEGQQKSCTWWRDNLRLWEVWGWEGH